MAVTNKRGIFSLTDIIERQSTGDWSARGDVWIPSDIFEKAHPFGYFGGGDNPSDSSLSSIDRVDYSNDNATASPKGSLSLNNSYLAATGNAFFGYFAGGYYSSSLSSVDRVDYSNDTASASPKGPLSAARTYFAGTSTQDFGYFAGSSTISTIDRIDYSNDTATALEKGSLSLTRYSLAATGNQDFGYFGGGEPGVRSTVDRIDYSNDTATASPKGPLSLARARLGATGNSNFGYYGGGFPGPTVATIDRIDYSNDTATASVRGSLNSNRQLLTATGSSSFGYFAGGITPGVVTVGIERVDYSNDTPSASGKGPLSVARARSAASSAQANAITLRTKFPATSERDNILPQGHDFGYVSGGNNPSFTGGATSKSERIDYSNDTSTATAAGSASPGGFVQTAGTGNANFGYSIAGYRFPGTRTYITRLDYSNDIFVQSPRGPLSAGKYKHAATSTEDFGYAIAGRNPSGTRVTSVDRIDYSNDTATASPKGPIDISRDNMSATGNPNLGFIAGGGYPLKSSIERIIYANDTATASIRSNLPANSHGQGAAGTADYGYWGGGSGPGELSRVDRLDYSNDTTNASSKGPLSSARYGPFGNSSTTHGYFGGGSASQSHFTSIDRIDFSSDTATASPKGNLIDARKQMASFSSRSNAIPTKKSVPVEVATVFFSHLNPVGNNYGFWGGSTPVASIMERIDFDNDTATAVVRAPLQGSRYYQGASGGQTHGYWGGGQPSPSSPYSSTIERIDYATDTPASATEGRTLLSARDQIQAIGNLTDIYFAGGRLPGNSYVTSVDRLSYANDATRTFPRGNLSTTKSGGDASGNTSYAWIGGGGNAGYSSSVDRIDYSNDTSTASPKGPLTLARFYVAAIGDGNYGYWGGGNPGFYTTIDRVDFSNDTATAVVRSPFSTNLDQRAAASNTNYGYWGGGRGPGPTYDSTIIERLDFANDGLVPVAKGNFVNGFSGGGATSPRSNGLSNTTTLLAGSLTVSNMGYFGGGENPNRTSIERVDFSNDTATALLKGGLTNPNLPTSSYYSTFGDTTNGYFAGSNINNTPFSSRVERMSYYNDTAKASTRGNMDSPAAGAAGFGNNNYGYVFNGYSVTTVRRIDFSNDIATGLTRGPTATSRYNCQGVSNQSYGYITGKWQSSVVERIDFANDNVSTTPVGPLTMTANRYGDAIGNSDYGWVVAGDAPSLSSKIDRIDYSNDTATASPRGPQSITTRYHGATGNADYGYIAGGQWFSTVDRVDYSNDTVTASPKGTLTSATGNAKGISAKESGYSATAVGPAVVANVTTQYFPIPLFGYFIGGGTPSSRTYIDRINYANDTETASFRGPLATAQSRGTAIGNTNFGYAAGGRTYYPGGTNIQRIDYNNDTATALYKGKITVSRQQLGATGNQNTGYFAGGKIAPSGFISTVDRIDYGNDTATASPKGPLSITRMEVAGTGNPNYGYFGGGRTRAGAPDYSYTSYSTIDRIDFSNDTATASPKGPFPSAVDRKASTGNVDYGWFAGDGVVHRVDYSNDTASASPRGPMGAASPTRKGMAATGNKDFGYFGSQSTHADSAKVERIDYANDTATASTKGPLAAARRYVAACSAAANGLPQ